GRLPDVRLPARLRLRRQRRRDRHAGPADLLLFRGVGHDGRPPGGLHLARPAVPRLRPQTRLAGRGRVRGAGRRRRRPGRLAGRPAPLTPRVRRGRTRPRATPYDRGMSTRTAFLKGHGTENDFVIVPDPENTVDLPPAAVAALCDRRAGLGGD